MYWLLKTEPTTYSWDDLVKEGSTEWDGVRNYEARNNMKKMKKGDLAFLYHSVKNPSIIGIVKVIAEAHPDSTDDTGTWECVDIAPVRALKRPISLAEIKQISACKDMVLVKRGRLSVQPVTEREWKAVLEIASE